ncbi:MAG: DUF2341 domain-containing protein [Candidatus Roizmanbacteria bacterium]|nr:MAG: DUF2341 domain-containing protein [Candidatus Roizmanbacteria bacterium]
MTKNPLIKIWYRWEGVIESFISPLLKRGGLRRNVGGRGVLNNKNTSPRSAGDSSYKEENNSVIPHLMRDLAKRRLLLISLLIILIGLPIVFLSLKYQSKTEAAWYNENWTYRQTVAITNSGTAQTDFQVSIGIGTSALIVSGKMQSDCDDLRVTDINGKILPFWIEPTTCNNATNSTTVWVKAPSISTSGTTLYVYYGNPSAPSGASATTQVFIREISNLQGSWNLDESSGTSIADSSGNGNTGTLANAQETNTTLTASTSTSISDTNNGNLSTGQGYDLNGIYNGMTLTMSGASCNVNGESRTISDYTGATKTITVSSAFSATPNTANCGYTINHHIAGKFGNGMAYDGAMDVGDQITTINNAGLNITGSLTMEFWMKFPSGAGGYYNAYMGKSSDNYLIHSYYGQVIFIISNGSYSSNFNNCQTPTNWNHFVATWDGSTRRTYANGSLCTSTSVTTAPASDSGGITIGSGGALNWPTVMDEAKIYNKALSQAEISDLYGTGSNQGYTTSNYANKVLVRKFSSSVSVGSPGSETQGPGPVGYWSFDDGQGTVAQDKSSSKNNGTISGATWTTEDQCISGKCLKFDGSNDVVTVPDSNALTPTDITFSMWIKSPSITGSQTFLGKWYTGTNQRSYYLYTGSSNVGLCISKDGTDPGASCAGSANNTLTNNTWYHITATYHYVTDGTSVIQIYINGVLSGSSSTVGGPIYNSTGNLNISTYDGTNQPFNGFIDEPKIYPYARTAAQVKTDYNSRGSAVKSGSGTALGAKNQDYLSNGLVGYWKMDETASPAVDSSGNGNSGTWTGDATSAVGKFGNGVTLDGTGDYVSLGNPAVLRYGSAITLSVWVKPTVTLQSGSPAESFIRKESGWSGYDLFYDGTNGRIMAILDNGTFNGYVTYNTNLTAGTWYHIVLTYDNSTGVIYVNGAQAASRSFATTVADSGVNLTLGAADGGSSAFNGVLDEARIYNRALSPGEVSQLYNWAPGPLAYWNMDEASGNLTDSSGNGYTGTASSLTVVPGKYGKARSFNGSSSTVTGSVSFNAGYTVSLWVNSAGNASGTQMIWEGQDLSAPSLEGNDTGYLFYMNNSNSLNTGALSTNRWYYVTATYDGSNQRLYIDGVLKGTNTSVASDSVTTFYLANRAGNSLYWNGTLDDVKIYNYARTSKQIVEDMNAGHPAVGSPVGSALAHWKFDEGYGSTANNSGNGGNTLNGTLGTGSSAPTWTNNGKFGKALSFDGTNDYVSIPDSDAFNFGTGDFTINLWFNNAGTTVSYPALISTYGGWSSGSFGIRHDNNGAASKVTVHWNPVGDPFITSTNTFADNTWNYVSLVRSGTSFTLYVNGKIEGTGTSATALDLAYGGNVDIGWGPWDGASGYWKGLIDEVKVYNYALTADEVKLDYNRGSSLVLGSLSVNTGNTAPISAASQEYCVPGDSTSCASPVGQWDFNEGVGATAFDTSGNGNVGYWNGTGSHWTNGKYGKAGNFNGSDDYVSTSSTFETTSATWEVWINLNNFTATGGYSPHILYQADGSGAHETRIVVNTNGTVAWNVYSTSYQCQLTSTTTLAIGNWYHIASQYGANGCNLYINGVREANNSTTNGPGTGAVRFAIGRLDFNSTGFTNGKIDQVRIFDYARSAAQIAWDYNRGGPVGWWKLDEGQGSTAFDSSGIGNTGSINIGASGTQTSIGTGSSAGTAWGNGVTGKFNYSLNFDGTDDFIGLGSSVPSALQIQNEITLSAWIYATSYPASDTLSMIVGSQNDTNTQGISIFLDGRTNPDSQTSPAGHIHFQIGDGSWHTTNANAAVSLNQWVHIVATRKANENAKIYYNGVPQPITSVAWTGAITYTAAQLNIGRQRDASGSTYRYFNGQIDDVKIFNYALTADQVTNLYNGGAALRWGPNTGSP